MIRQALEDTRRLVAKCLDGVCSVHTQSPKALKDLNAARPVAIVTDPDVNLDSYTQATLTFEIWLAAPGTDEPAARAFFDRALTALRPLGYENARAQMMNSVTGSMYMAYLLTYETVYTL